MIRRIILIILGAILLISGISYGALSSHQTPYQTVEPGTIAHYLASDTTHNGYLQMSNSSKLFIIRQQEFTPAIDGINTFKDGDTISVMYNPDDTQDIDITSTLGTHLQGTAYNVVKIDQINDNGQKTTFTSAGYSTNPRGSYNNHWGTGAGMAFLGLLLIVAGIFTGRRSTRTGFSISPSTAMSIGTPAQTPYQQPVNPYQQPYPAPTQYPGPSEQYQPPYNPYAQQQMNPGTQYSQPGMYPPQNPQSGQYQPGYEPTVRATPPAQSGYEPTQRANPYNQPPQN